MTYTTDQYEGMIAETIVVRGYGGTLIHAYDARPLGPGPFSSVILIPHALGWNDYYKETARRFAYFGYIAVVPDIWCRVGHGSVEDVIAKSRAEGGLSDAQVVGDAEAAALYVRALPISNGKVGVMGSCSGGRHTFLAACRTDGVFDAAINCWGGNVIQPQERLTEGQPVSPFEYSADLSCPLLGLFGNDDPNPSREQVDVLEQELTSHGKDIEFHRYDDAGHGFFYAYLSMYRQEQSVDGWNRIWEFLGRNLSI